MGVARGAGKDGAKRLGQPSSAVSGPWKRPDFKAEEWCVSKASACLFPFSGLEASNSRFAALVIQVRDIIHTPPCGQL